MNRSVNPRAVRAGLPRGVKFYGGQYWVQVIRQGIEYKSRRWSTPEPAIELASRVLSTHPRDIPELRPKAGKALSSPEAKPLKAAPVAPTPKPVEGARARVSAAWRMLVTGRI